MRFDTLSGPMESTHLELALFLAAAWVPHANSVLGARGHEHGGVWIDGDTIHTLLVPLGYQRWLASARYGLVALSQVPQQYLPTQPHGRKAVRRRRHRQRLHVVRVFVERVHALATVRAPHLRSRAPPQCVGGGVPVERWHGGGLQMQCGDGVAKAMVAVVAVCDNSVALRH
jgi:hypothetical protein